jgi:hypothetical protein
MARFLRSKWGSLRFPSVGIGAGCVAIMLFLFFGSKRVEKQRLNEEIERCRLAFRPK